MICFFRVLGVWVGQEEKWVRGLIWGSGGLLSHHEILYIMSYNFLADPIIRETVSVGFLAAYF